MIVVPLFGEFLFIVFSGVLGNHVFSVYRYVTPMDVCLGEVVTWNGTLGALSGTVLLALLLFLWSRRHPVAIWKFVTAAFFGVLLFFSNMHHFFCS